jgi:hypothetical protein
MNYEITYKLCSKASWLNTGHIFGQTFTYAKQEVLRRTNRLLSFQSVGRVNCCWLSPAESINLGFGTHYHILVLSKSLRVFTAHRVFYRHGPRRKHVQQYCCCVYIRCRGNVFIGPLSDNHKGATQAARWSCKPSVIFSLLSLFWNKEFWEELIACFPSVRHGPHREPKNKGGYTQAHRQTYRQQGDLTCVPLFFKNKENKLKRTNWPYFLTSDCFICGTR